LNTYVLSRIPFADVVATALRLDWTRDPFDRLIVAQAIAEDANLATRDRVVRRNFKGAIWD
jgi:PIN domain nuclease of toxin-antitoxin system